jgi:hypothetical protein
MIEVEAYRKNGQRCATMARSPITAFRRRLCGRQSCQAPGGFVVPDPYRNTGRTRQDQVEPPGRYPRGSEDSRVSEYGIDAIQRRCRRCARGGCGGMHRSAAGECRRRRTGPFRFSWVCSRAVTPEGCSMGEPRLHSRVGDGSETARRAISSCAGR